MYEITKKLNKVSVIDSYLKNNSKYYYWKIFSLQRIMTIESYQNLLLPLISSLFDENNWDMQAECNYIIGQ